MLTVAINGFGRIGRAFFRVAQARDDMRIAAINDLGEIENLAYLLRYDSAYGKSHFAVEADAEHNAILIDGTSVPVYQEKDPGSLPWKHHEIDVVVEATGAFTDYTKAAAHLKAGAKRVVISAPAKGDIPEGLLAETVLMGINDEALKTCQLSSNASCTTNAAGPLIAIVDEHIGVAKALLNTVHAYTASQSIVDGPSHKDFRSGRAAATNLIPSSTGAAIATAKVIPSLEDKFDGIAVRVPVLVGSLVDVTFLAKRDTSVEEVNDILRTAAGEARWQHTFTVSEEPLVSSDIIGERHASIADLSFTRVADGNLVKVLAWYDNEMGYAYSLIAHVAKIGSYLRP